MQHQDSAMQGRHQLLVFMKVTKERQLKPNHMLILHISAALKCCSLRRLTDTT
jgi:hypothetical protein